MDSFKSDLPEHFLPIGLLLGIFSSLRFQISLDSVGATLFLVVLLGAGLWLKSKISVHLFFLICASVYTGNIVTSQGLERTKARLPKPQDLNRSYKIQARALRQWETKYGTAVSVDNIRILNPTSVSWELDRLTLYMPANEQQVARHTEITAWVRLKRRWQAKPTPFPMQDFQNTYFPNIVGSVKSLDLIEMETSPLIVDTNLNKGNRELIDIFIKGSPSFIWRERLAPFGLGHLLAISGLHCIFLYFIIQLVIWPLRKPVLRFIFTAAGLLLFADWVGWSASVTRASLMMIIWHLLPQLGRPRSWMRIWTGLMLIALISNPMYLFMRGFWYSFAASLGLILGSRFATPSPLDHPLLLRLRPILPILSAQLFVTPINLMFTTHSAFTSLFWNILGLLFLIIILLLLALCLISLAIPGLAFLPNGLERMLSGGAEVFQGYDGLWELIRFPFTPSVVVLVLLSMTLCLKFGAKELRWYATIAVLCLLLMFNKPLEGERLVMLDIGQGLCILYVSPEGEGWLFDAGGQLPHGMSLKRIARLMGAVHIRTAFISHLNYDHYSFLETLSSPIVVYAPEGRIGEFRGNDLFAPFSIVPVQKGHIFNLNKIKGTVLWPESGLDYPNSNEESLVIELKGESWTLLITGDAGVWMEKRLKDFQPEGTGILIVGHHGSKSGTSLSFLNSWKPEYALISCGRENRFGHPHPNVTENLKSANSTVLSTDKLGSIVIIEGDQLVLKPF